MLLLILRLNIHLNSFYMFMIISSTLKLQLFWHVAGWDIMGFLGEILSAVHIVTKGYGEMPADSNKTQSLPGVLTKYIVATLNGGSKTYLYQENMNREDSARTQQHQTCRPLSGWCPSLLLVRPHLLVWGAVGSIKGSSVLRENEKMQRHRPPVEQIRTYLL